MPLFFAFSLSFFILCFNFRSFSLLRVFFYAFVSLSAHVLFSFLCFIFLFLFLCPFFLLPCFVLFSATACFSSLSSCLSLFWGFDEPSPSLSMFGHSGIVIRLSWFGHHCFIRPPPFLWPFSVSVRPFAHSGCSGHYLANPAIPTVIWSLRL